MGDSGSHSCKSRQGGGSDSGLSCESEYSDREAVKPKYRRLYEPVDALDQLAASSGAAAKVSPSQPNQGVQVGVENSLREDYEQKGLENKPHLSQGGPPSESSSESVELPKEHKAFYKGFLKA